MVWTAEQTGAFLDFVYHDRLYALYHLIAYRGLRRGEACGARWIDLDAASHSLIISEQLVQLGWEVEAGKPKSDAGGRIVTLDTITNAAIETWRKRQIAERLEWGSAWTNSGRIFTHPDGSALHPAEVTKAFNGRAAAGLPPIRLHDLRHGAATHALEAGVDIKVVQEELGHSTSVLTRDTYTSVSPRLARAEAERVAQAIPRAVQMAPEAATGTLGPPSVPLGPKTKLRALPSRKNAQLKAGAPPGTRTPNPRIKSQRRTDASRACGSHQSTHRQVSADPTGRTYHTIHTTPTLSTATEHPPSTRMCDHPVSGVSAMSGRSAVTCTRPSSVPPTRSE
ncbi:site-specific integrase [Micromonospora sp. KC606]|uniref:tyrosine-type recombinase/integrase n=1 Tax=Micromonospora sp. KC606 TaxID=2530379 RepID=UPI0010454C25|nr:site-specific integrase [Micromonospora sp. KC606]TDC85919.1 site-specific integrase [Micromonospora sp. KC606]